MNHQSATSPAVDIEQLVRQVLGEFLARSAAGTSASAVAASAAQASLASSEKSVPAAAPTPAEANNKLSVGQLRIDSRVITLETISGQLNGIRELIVRQGAIVTPAVKDRLRESKIAISVAPQGGNAAARTAQVVLGTTEPAVEVSSIAAQLGKMGAAVQQVARTGLKNVIQEMCDAVGRGGQLGIVCTSRVTAAICLANRVPGVRAAQAGDGQTVEQIIRDVGANLLVLDCSNSSSHSLCTLAERFVAPGMRRCPSELENALG